jgi:hypothetical protein
MFRQWYESSAKEFHAPTMTSRSGVYDVPQLPGRGRLPADWLQVRAEIGGPVPAGAKLRFSSGEVEGQTITVRLLYDQNELRKSVGVNYYLSATVMLPETLPDGEYDVHLLIEGVPDELAFSAAPATSPTSQPSREGLARRLSARVARPHPSLRLRREYMAQLRTLNDEQLIAEYYRTGELLRADNVGPLDGHALEDGMVPCDHPSYGQFQDVRSEMVRRLPGLRPRLVDVLRKEWSRNATSNRRYDYGYAQNLMNLMKEDRDPATAAVYVEMLEAPEGAIFGPLRYRAAMCLEQLTYLSVRRTEPMSGWWAYAIRDPAQVPITLPYSHEQAIRMRAFEAVAQHYRAWLSNAGKDPVDWLPLALKRARRCLRDDDLENIYWGAAFLAGALDIDAAPQPRDDEPSDTLRIVDNVLAGVSFPGRTVDGKTIPVSILSWAQLIPRYGPRARPYVGRLVDLQQRLSYEWKWTQITGLAEIGGRQVIEKFIEWQPLIEQEIADQNLNGRCRDDETVSNSQRWLLTYRRTLLWGVQRWTGHAFRDWNEIREWWDANKDKTEEEWMRQGLPLTAERADAGQADAQALLRTLVPQLPADANELSFTRPPYGGPRRTPFARPFRVFRAEWIRENIDRLKFDRDSGTFQLQQ